MYDARFSGHCSLADEAEGLLIDRTGIMNSA
jgi:hypothetical protein